MSTESVPSLEVLTRPAGARFPSLVSQAVLAVKDHYTFVKRTIKPVDGFFFFVIARVSAGSKDHTDAILFFPFDRREGAPRADNRAAIAPTDEVLGHGFGPRSRIGGACCRS